MKIINRGLVRNFNPWVYGSFMFYAEASLGAAIRECTTLISTKKAKFRVDFVTLSPQNRGCSLGVSALDLIIFRQF